jgi:hypothetical protein
MTTDPARHSDEMFAARVYDCAALMLFGDENAVNFGAEKAREWLPRLLQQQDSPGLYALQELARRYKRRPIAAKGMRAGGLGDLCSDSGADDGDDGCDGDDVSGSSAGSLAGGPAKCASPGTGGDDGGDDTARAGRDDNVPQPHMTITGPRPTAKRSRTAARSGVQEGSGVAAKRPTSGFRLLAGHHSLTAVGSASSGGSSAGSKATAFGFSQAGAAPLLGLEPQAPALGLPAYSVAPLWAPIGPQVGCGGGDDGSVCSPRSEGCWPLGVDEPLDTTAAALLAAALPPAVPDFTTSHPLAPRGTSRLQDPENNAMPAGPGMVPVEQSDRAAAALYADAHDMCMILPSPPPLAQPQPCAIVQQACSGSARTATSTAAPTVGTAAARQAEAAAPQAQGLPEAAAAAVAAAAAAAAPQPTPPGIPGAGGIFSQGFSAADMDEWGVPSSCRYGHLGGALLADFSGFDGALAPMSATLMGQQACNELFTQWAAFQ